MSDFIAANLHKKVDHIMDVFYGAGVASHPTIIEQINYLLFMRALSQRDDELKAIGITDVNELVFDGDLEKYHWDNLMTLNAEQLFVALEDCLRKIPESTTNKTVRLVFRNAHIKLFDKASLRTVFHEIDAFGKLMDEGEHEGKKDIFGDTYEYLLSKLAQAGTSGQFRTPRHIIDFLVAVVAPKKGETILDPAVGTAGFLVKAFEYLRREYTSPEQLASGGSFDLLSTKEHNVLFEHTFSGFDSDEDMIKFGMMNLYLHGLQNAKLIRQNTLTDTAGSRDKYDIILANPPFSGKIDRDSVAEELQMNTGATEVLFLRYMMRHLTDEGRVGVIVPEGVLFNASGAHTKIREMLLEHGLWCVVSLPSGIFNPYAGVKTSILFFDKTHKDKAEVLFAKVEHDGFSLSAQRRPIAKNDLPEILEDIKRYQTGEDLQQPNAHVVSYEQIKETKDFNLSGDRYKLVESRVDHKYTTVKLGELLDVFSGFAFQSKFFNETGDGLPLIRIRDIKTGTSKTYYSGDYDEAFLVNDGDLLVGMDGEFNPTIWNSGKALLNQRVCRLQNFRNVEKEFVYYTIRQKLKKIEATTYAVTVKHISAKQIKEIEIPLPPLEIQKKIVEEIENKQKAIDHAREIIKTLERERAYFDPSARAQKEGWPIVTVGEKAKLTYGFTAAAQSTGSQRFIRITDIAPDGTLRRQGKKYIDASDDSKPYTLKQKDILVARTGATYGKTVLYTDNEPATFASFLIKIEFNDRDVMPEYYWLFAQTNNYTSQARRLMTGGTQPQFNTPAIKQIAFPLPPLDVQKQIVEEFAEEQKIVTANQKLIALYTQKIQSKLAEVWGEER